MAVGLYSGVSGLALGVGLYKGNSGLWGGASGLINGFGGSGPFPGASLYLDFLTPPLDPRITFSRGSNATLVDATGKITYAPANLLLYSQSLATSPWENGIAGTGVTPTVTDNAGVAPDGTTTATRIQLSLGGGNSAADLSRRRQPATVQAVSHIFSVWIRSTDGTSSYNIHLQDVINATRNITVTGTWTRYDASAVSPGTLSYLSVGLRGGQAPANSNTADILVWGAQLEPVTYQTVPGTYNATTASAYYGPRFDYDPVTLAPKGLLIEEQRTNLVTYSQQFDDAAWSKSLGTVTANATASPDGTTNADAFIESASAGQHFVSQPTGSTATGSFTFSVFVKANGRNGINLWIRDGGAGFIAEAFFNLSAGTATVSGMLLQAGWSAPSATIQTFANGWYRCVLTATADATLTQAKNVFVRLNDGTGSNPSYTGNGTSGIYLYGAQIEVGSFATSYIPTVASTVTRNADAATMTGTNFSSWFNPTSFTIITDFDVLNYPAGVGYIGGTFGFGTSSPRVKNGIGSASDRPIQTQFFDGVNNILVRAGTFGDLTANVSVKHAVAFSGLEAAATYNGLAVNTGTSATPISLSAITRAVIGNLPDTNAYLNGHIRQIAYYNTRLPNAQLQTLTAPSLATTLSLSFTNQAYTVGV